MDDNTSIWEQWDKDRKRHQNRFHGKGCAQVSGIFGFVGVMGTLMGCAVMFGALDGGILRGLGMLAVFWAPLLGWVILIALYQMTIEKIESNKRLKILLDASAPGQRCRAAYRLSVIQAKEAIPHLESLLNDDTTELELRGCLEKSLAKLKEIKNNETKSEVPNSLRGTA